MSVTKDNNINVEPTAPEYQNVQENNVRNEPGIRKFLSNRNWPYELETYFINSANEIYIRYFIYDDSGSMSTTDGKKFNGNFIEKCSRWQELSEVFDFHMRVCNAGLINAKFIFLNKGSFMFGEDNVNINNFIQQFDEMTGGYTPLCAAIQSIINDMVYIQVPPGRKIEVVLCTDGLSSDGDVGLKILQLIRNYPVKLVLKLCTDEENVVNYWNKLDHDFELNLDILDDYISESQEVYKVNPKICYPKIIHQLREFGVTNQLFDHIDEQEFTEIDLIKYASFFVGKDIISDYKDSSKREIVINKIKSCKYYCIIEKKLKLIVDISEKQKINNVLVESSHTKKSKGSKCVIC